MNTFYNCINLQNDTTSTVNLGELKIKHYKIILKTLLNPDLDCNSIFLNLNFILRDIASLSNKQLLSLDIVDYFILLFEARINCIGNVIFVEKQSDTKIEINLNKLLDTIKKAKEMFLENCKQSINSIEIVYKLPTILDVLTSFDTDIVNDIYPTFIKSLNIDNTYIDFESLTTHNKSNILLNLPAYLTTSFVKKTLDIVKQFNELNLLHNILQLNDQKLLFNFNKKNLAFIVKLLYNGNLLSVYENIFVLAKACNMSPDYIENITPGEYMIFLKKLEELNSKQETSNNSSESFDHE